MQILTMFNKVVAYNENGYTPVGNAAICAATGECHKDVLITTVDCVPTDIEYYDYYYINGKFVKGGPKSELRETNHNGKMSFWLGTQAEYNAIPTEDIVEDCLYIITDDTTGTQLARVLSGELAVPKAETAVKLGLDVPAPNYNNKLIGPGYYYVYASITGSAGGATFNGQRAHFGIVYWEPNHPAFVASVPMYTMSSIGQIVEVRLTIGKDGSMVITGAVMNHAQNQFSSWDAGYTIYTQQIAVIVEPTIPDM